MPLRRRQRGRHQPESDLGGSGVPGSLRAVRIDVTTGRNPDVDGSAVGAALLKKGADMGVELLAPAAVSGDGILTCVIQLPAKTQDAAQDYADSLMYLVRFDLLGPAAADAKISVRAA